MGVRRTSRRGVRDIMTERALTSPRDGADVADLEEMRPENPAVRLLDALRDGDDRAVVAEVGQMTTVTAENMPWACRGPDEVETMLREARDRFPGLTFESSTRHVGFGLVIEEARVRDVEAEAAAASAAEVTAEADAPTDTVTDAVPDADLEVAPDPAPYDGTGSDDSHPMWDEPVAERRLSALSLWQQQGHAALPAVPLNLPVRVTIRHDDLQVHEITLSFPAALLKRALGQHVDPFEMSLSEVQSAFIAPVGAGFTTHRLARPELTLAPAPPVDEPPVAEPASAEPPRRRRRGGVALVLVVLLALVAGAGWWFLQGEQDAGPQATAPQPSLSATVTPSSQPTAEPTTQPSSSEAPSVTRTQSTAKPTRKPNVTLRSDLAFGFNSAQLSGAAKAAIATVAAQVHSAGLSGKIYVDGYTDNLGSAAYGLVLSQRRADAVSAYLQSQLLGEPVSIVSVGHGESNPLVSNATASGQKQNRRVTITLPRP